MVPLEQLAPAAIAELGRLRRRADDVREQNGGQNGFGLRVLPTTRIMNSKEEALDLVAEALEIFAGRHVPCPGQLDQPCTRNSFGGVASAFDRNVVVLAVYE